MSVHSPVYFKIVPFCQLCRIYQLDRDTPRSGSSCVRPRTHKPSRFEWKMTKINSFWMKMQQFFHFDVVYVSDLIVWVAVRLIWIITRFLLILILSSRVGVMSNVRANEIHHLTSWQCSRPTANVWLSILSWLFIYTRVFQLSFGLVFGTKSGTFRWHSFRFDVKHLRQTPHRFH